MFVRNSVLKYHGHYYFLSKSTKR